MRVKAIIPPVDRCARSRCPRRAVKIAGEKGPQLCIGHQMATKPRAKYRNERAESVTTGRSFASKAERARGEELALLERSGAIRNLRFQVPVSLHGRNGGLICRWIADFVYEQAPTAYYYAPKPQELTEDGFRIVYEDMKGFRTDLYAIKAKLFRDEYGFPIYETKPARKR